MRAFAAMVLFATCAQPLWMNAQWINYPTAGIPRLPNGKPNLDAPAPRTADGKPDLSGLWQPASGGADPQFTDIAKQVQGGLPFQKWAADLVKSRRAENNKDDPDGHCQPLGTVKMHLHPYPRKILQLPGLMVILYERDTVYRQIFTDGRPLPQDPQPSFYGYSTAKWDGDTLVVETIGFKDGLWLDISGTPLTDAAKVTERYHRPTFGKLEIDVTVDDPKAYTKPWTIRVNQTLAVDMELLQFFCVENEKDWQHLVGK
ncbi:MAG TPA: hypothetical protein VFW44_20115 [Bryobacteraceae bacterium]|nr:hypothetical protein [Bryobacteraceae bacterium]